MDHSILLGISVKKERAQNCNFRFFFVFRVHVLISADLQQIYYIDNNYYVLNDVQV